MEETGEFFPSHCLAGQAGRSLYPTGRLFSVDLLTPATSCRNRAPTAQVQGISVMAKAAFYLDSHDFGDSSVPQAVARNAHAVCVWHFFSLSLALLHTKPVSVLSLLLFCQRRLMAQTLWAPAVNVMALATKKAGCFRSNGP